MSVALSAEGNPLHSFHSADNGLRPHPPYIIFVP